MRNICNGHKGAALGCEARSADELEPAGTCQQTGEFGNFGCAEVAGVVTDINGAPLANVRVEPTGFGGRSQFSGAAVTTGNDGIYSFRIVRFGQAYPPLALDTVTIYVLATRGLPPAAQRESTPVVVQVYPIGSVPKLARTNLVFHPTQN